MLRPHCFQRWFNIAPGDNAQALFDKCGEKHWLIFSEDEYHVDFNVFRAGDFVADAQLDWNEDNSLYIRIIEVHRNNYMRRSLGTLLLQQVITYAKQKNAIALKGFIAPQHYEQNPHLLDWYRQYGFQVTPIQGSFFIAEIYLDLIQVS